MAHSEVTPREWILLAHESALLREGLAPTLASLGFEVVEAETGSDAITHLHGDPPSAAVIQSDLPGHSSLQLIQALRAHPVSKRMPILVIQEGPHGGAEALRAGASDVARLPIEPAVVARRLSVWLHLRETRELLLRGRQALRGLQRVAGIATFELDIQSGIFEGSEEIQCLFGFGSEEKVRLELLLSRIPPEDRQVVRSFFQMSRESGDGFSVETEVELPGQEGRVIHWQADVVKDRRGRAERIVGSVQDVTERTRAEQQVRHLAYHDGLTGLTNRNAFMESLREALQTAERHQHSVALLFLDLDHFKRINDSLGHSTGDLLLKRVARRLDACVRQSDLVTRSLGAVGGVSRLGGDEFTVLLSEVSGPEDVKRVARRILESITEPVVIEHNELRVGVSIGVTMFPDDGCDVDSLLRNADVAMYQAKEQGRSNVQFYGEGLSESERRRTAIEGGLTRALREERFSLRYQPQIEGATGRVVGVEALVRWKDLQLGTVSPGEFVPVAEDTGLIPKIGDWVLTAACERARGWLDAGLPPLRVSVNTSARQFESEAILELVGQTLFDTGLPAEQLVLEVTESVFSRDPEAVASLLRQIKQLGVRISLDDFGTGYSSLSYLKRFPVDEIKIDHSFVRDVPLDADDTTIIQAILSIGSALGLAVVAEGVETLDQCRFLLERRCELMQGHLFSEAIDGLALEQALRVGSLEGHAHEILTAAGGD